MPEPLFAHYAAIMGAKSWFDPAAYSHLQPWVIALFLGLLTLLFEDVALLIGVALVHEKADLLMPIFVGLYTGIAVGDALLYVAGRWLKHIGFVQRWMARLGMLEMTPRLRRNFLPMLVICRAIPASRLPTLMMAGFLRLPVVLFATIIALSVLVWVGAILLGGVNLAMYFETSFGFSAAWLLPFLLSMWFFSAFLKRSKVVA